MRIDNYKRYIYYMKGPGVCIVAIGSCWCLYHMRQTSHLFRSLVTTNIVDIEQTRAQYIYIDDPRFKDESMFIDESLHLNPIEQKRSMSETISKWWKSLNHSFACKLLHMAQHGDTSERLKAMYTLNSMKYLKDWHYRQIAQTLDARTAVTLARMPDVDSRFFLRPPYYHIQYKLYDVIETVHKLLLHLKTLCDNTHPCLFEFLNKKFGDSHRDGPLFEHDFSSLGLAAPPTIVWDKELLLNCVQALCHHSCLEKYSKNIVEAGGLPVLMMIKKIFNDNTNVCILLAKIISNISMHSEYLNDIFRSGWISILVEWSRHPDICLSAPASRALANLDMDENVKYPRRIYLLHPLHKSRSPVKLDVVFVHGLLGGVFITWRQRDRSPSTARVVDSRAAEPKPDVVTSMIGEHTPEFLNDLARDLQMLEWNRIGQDFEVILDDCPVNIDYDASGPYFCSGDDECMRKTEQDKATRTQCWPKDWLPTDVPFLRIIGVNYDTNLSMWTPLCPVDHVKATLNERSGEYARKLLVAGVGKRPVVWVCHSMGGLLVKRMLVDEWKSGDPNGICKNTRGIIFYSTPHRGSHVAALRHTTEMLLWPSVEVQELREESPHLLQLHQQFLDLLKEHPIEIISFSETKPTLVTALKLQFQFVLPSSADPGVGEFFEIPQDHLCICKPANRQSFLYQKLITVLKRHVSGEKKSSSIMELLSKLNKLV